MAKQPEKEEIGRRIAAIDKELRALDEKTSSGAFGRADVERRKALEAERDDLQEKPKER